MVKPKEAAEWIEAHQFLKDVEGVPEFLENFVAKQQRLALRLVHRTVPKGSLPAWADALKLRAALERKLEEACKATKKRRDPVAIAQRLLAKADALAKQNIYGFQQIGDYNP